MRGMWSAFQLRALQESTVHSSVPQQLCMHWRNSLIDVLGKFGERNSNCDSSDTGDFQVYTVNATLGSGHSCFTHVSKLVLSGNLTNRLSWASLSSLDKEMKVGSVLATTTRFYNVPLVTINPSRIKCFEFDKPGNEFKPTAFEVLRGRMHLGSSVKRYSRMIYSTLLGHLLSGEESLYVYLHEDDKVEFEMTTFAGAGARIMQPFLPLVRPLQRKFLNDHIKCIIEGISSSSSLSGQWSHQLHKIAKYVFAWMYRTINRLVWSFPK